MGKQWKQWETIFLGSKITADGDCSPEIKRCLLLGRKGMTNLDSILKSRDITLLTKVHLVKATAFPVVIYGMWELDYKESWALKNWCFWTAMLEKTLESPLDYREIQPVHPKGSQPWIFIGRTDAEAETPILCPSECEELTPWKKSYDQPRQHIKKQRHYFADKGLSSQSYGFSSSRVWVRVGL